MKKSFFVIILFLSTSFIDSSGSPIIRGLKSGFSTRQQGQILYQAPKCLHVPLHRADFDLASTSDLTIGGPHKAPILLLCGAGLSSDQPFEINN